jgi:molybdopterin-containing oxidoreductase family membrane subunit
MSRPAADLGTDEALIRPLHQVSPKLYILVGVLVLLVLNMFIMFGRQVGLGLGVTGMNQPVTWGFYIVNFVFFIGISHAGTLISAILRLSQAEWRRPITRMAEVITVIVLAIGAVHPIIDLGRPDRLLNVFTSGRLQSPLLWDVTAISAYFMASTVYLFLPLIPDIAMLRDRGGKLRPLYEFLSWGYTGTAQQKRVLEKAMTVMMIIVIPIAVSVHTGFAHRHDCLQDSVSPGGLSQTDSLFVPWQAAAHHVAPVVLFYVLGVPDSILRKRASRVARRHV